MNKYDPAKIESKWQKIWSEKGIYQPDLEESKKPFFNLMMFPYPSAEGLHVGNVYAFTGSDIYGRLMRMKGYDVFEPIGLDGFGIHSENYSLKVGKNPAEQAKISEKNFYRQLKAIGNGFAWQNRLETYDPGYYKWTQWIFIQMFKAGLAYRKKATVNFCPSCKTVLSDEQVLPAGRQGIAGACERCKANVVKKDLAQWFFRITKYAERLLKNLERIDWTEKVKVAQRNWIGKKEGININYSIVNEKGEVVKLKGKPLMVSCFTTRPDTNFGATFVVLAPEHSIIKKILNPKFEILNKLKIQNYKKKKIKDYIQQAKKKTTIERIAEGREKTGVFTGFYCLNQLNNQKMPLYISDFVLMDYGTGAVVGVPGHDKRDFEFAQKFKLPVIRVVVGPDNDKLPITCIEQVQEETGKMINSEFLNGMDIYEATKVMMDYLEKKGWGKRVTTFRLRDWCISRQRYWGAPIPMIYCEHCAKKGMGEKKEMPGWFPVPESELPVLLPKVKDWRPEGAGKGPLDKIPEFYNVKCPQCGGQAKRETDVCDTFLDSAWYFLRYPSITKNGKDTPGVGLDSPGVEKKESLPWNPEIIKSWLPVNMYIGGAEHSVLHLMYSRFLTMVFKDLGLIDFEEPFSSFRAHGLLISEGAKMSKSKGNVVIPDQYIKKYGADTLRMYLMFIGPFSQGGDFRDEGIIGIYRFLGKVWRLVTKSLKDTSDGGPAEGGDSSEVEKAERDSLNRIMHQTIKKVTEDIENLSYNTAIAVLMEFLNRLTVNNKQLIANKEMVKTLLLLLAPFAPHMTEELWLQLGEKFSIHTQKWPQYDSELVKDELLTIVVEVNSKVRSQIQVGSESGGAARSEIEKLAKKEPKVAKYLRGKKIKRVIFVPARLINFVTN